MNIDAHTGANDTDTNFTSWSDDPDVALGGAQNLGGKWVGEGVMLRIRAAKPMKSVSASGKRGPL